MIRILPLRQILAAVLVASLSGCFSMVQPIKPNQGPGPAFESLHDPQTILVGLAVSGGGSRAATFAAGALEALARMTVTDSGRRVSVLEKVNYISSVSGGSLASAYYALDTPGKTAPVLDGIELSPAYEVFFQRFKADMQTDFERPAAIRQFLKFRAFNSTKAAYSLAEVWDDLFFHNKTFADLFAREREGNSPRLILNGTRWNDGRRFVFTTLPMTDFQPTFATRLLDTLKQSQTVPEDEKALIQNQLRNAYDQFRPVSFQNIAGDSGVAGDFQKLNVSLAVASSASVPGAIGPVTYLVDNKSPYHHIGDGGLFDNQGVESLTELFLNKLSAGPGQQPGKKALIIMIDASYPFDAAKADLDKADTALDVLTADPFRIQGMMEQRALAYQLALWSVLRSESASFLPDFEHLRIVRLRHTDAKWSGYDDLPEVCKEHFPPAVTSKQINEEISKIPTLLRLKTSCHGALLIKAAQKVLNQNRERIASFMQISQN
jgi:predicted acylesterase/phospholipase RssA